MINYNGEDCYTMAEAQQAYLTTGRGLQSFRRSGLPHYNTGNGYYLYPAKRGHEWFATSGKVYRTKKPRKAPKNYANLTGRAESWYCLDCKHVTNKYGVCSWVDKFIPVEGWEARETVKKNGKGYNDASYDIKFCPLYENEKTGEKGKRKKGKMTQNDRVYNYMVKYGSITQTQATQELGVTWLAQRINDLKREGVIIQSEKVGVKDRYGDTRYVKRYKLDENEETGEKGKRK